MNSKRRALRRFYVRFRRFAYTHIYLLLTVFAVFISLYIYTILLSRYGTIAPFLTSLYTSPYHGRTAYDYPPASWRPSFRVVVSLTTTPNRIGFVRETIESLINQSLPPDQIYLHIPKGSMRRQPSLSYDTITIPSELRLLTKTLIINRCEDDGPATKLLATLPLELDPNTLIITVDDDFVYPSRLVEALAWESELHSENALGVCGWGMMDVSWLQVKIVPAYAAYFMRQYGRYVDILQACCGNAYRRGFFNHVEEMRKIVEECVTVDDIWIAGYLKMVEKRKAAIISKRLDPVDPEWKQKRDVKAMTLSMYNHMNNVHHKCVEAMERKFEEHWSRNYES